MRKLLVIPGWCISLGGMTVSLSLLIRGFERCGASEQIRVLVQEGSLLEEYLRQAGQGYCLQLIPTSSQRLFVKQALQWVSQQPQDWPLLLENCVSRRLLPIVAQATPELRLSRRPVYYMCHDLALSYNLLGNICRSLAFACLSPQVLCNSQFTAGHVRGRLGKVQGILYQPVDLDKFNNRPPSTPPPEDLRPILASGARIMLTPSRISKEDNFNDKNLRGLIPVLADLKASGHHYHGVVIGQDTSSGQTRTQALLDQAASLGVADRFTVLPATFAIENYYKHADVVVTLAPREPFGRTVVEAIACGVPVVGSHTGGISEILNHFAPQWTVDPNDPAAAAKAIVSIAADQNTPNLLAQGKHWVETNCSVVGYARRLQEITRLDTPISINNPNTSLLNCEGYNGLHLPKAQ